MARTLFGYRVHYTCNLFPGRRIAIRVVMPHRLDVNNLGHRHVVALRNVIADASDEREDTPLPVVDIFKIEILGSKQGEWDRGFCRLLDRPPHLKPHRSQTGLLNAVQDLKIKLNPGLPKQRALQMHEKRLREDRFYRQRYERALKSV